MTTEIGTDILKVAAHLRQGDVVAIPTETVYGLAGNALNDDAVLKIFHAKERPQFNPLIIHLSSWDKVPNYVADIPASASILAAAFSPGPITFLLPKKSIIPDLVTAGSPKVAVRIPSHPLTLQLLQEIDFPVAAPSANRFGYVSPVTALHVYEGLNQRIPYILDGGSCPIGVESTIVDFENEEVIVRRTGKISVDEISRVLNRKVRLETSAEKHPVAPGMLKSHYATSTPLLMGNLLELATRNTGKKMIVLGWGTDAELLDSLGGEAVQNIIACMSLSEIKSIDEVAKHLFATMRKADTMGADLILVHPFPNEGIGMAVNDRLKRAQVEK
ncbi:MAG TPA: L-threonylcarbamoyladenylate synthase [Phnomibacter sp.]|nr:L-threonylcarbamoyladenylate synthase [Phnomibacter sp.]